MKGLSQGHVSQKLMSKMTHQNCNLIIKRTYSCIVQNTITEVISFNSQNNAVADGGGGRVNVRVCRVVTVLHLQRRQFRLGEKWHGKHRLSQSEAAWTTRPEARSLYSRWGRQLLWSKCWKLLWNQIGWLREVFLSHDSEGVSIDSRLS